MSASATGLHSFDAAIATGSEATPEQAAARRRLDAAEADVAVARLELKLADAMAFAAPAQQLTNLEHALADAGQEAARLRGRAEGDC